STSLVMLAMPCPPAPITATFTRSLGVSLRGAAQADEAVAAIAAAVPISPRRVIPVRIAMTSSHFPVATHLASPRPPKQGVLRRQRSRAERTAGPTAPL